MGTDTRPDHQDTRVRASVLPHGVTWETVQTVAVFHSGGSNFRRTERRRRKRNILVISANCTHPHAPRRLRDNKCRSPTATWRARLRALML
jgi:hypothetical protein